MAIWNGNPGIDEAGVEAALTAYGAPTTADVYQQSVLAGQYLANNDIVASHADIVALPTLKTGLQRTSFSVASPTTNQVLLGNFDGIGYGIWRILISASVAIATVNLQDQSGNPIWNYARTLAIGGGLGLESDTQEYLWRSPSGGGVNLVKDAGSTVVVEIWFDYLYA